MFITHEKYSPKKIRYGFFTKEINVPKPPSFDQLKKLGEYFGSESVAIVNQKHTNNVLLVEEYGNMDYIADGQVTNKKNIALGVLTADCVPVLLADEENSVIATVHAGWRGAKDNIMKVAVEKMNSLGAKNITSIIGPCIKQRNYEVSETFYREFIEQSEINNKFFILSSKPNHYMFDLPGYVKAKLIEAGVKEIFDIDRDTYEEENNFFSFRRTTHNPDSPMGSLISMIMLIP